MQDIAHLNKSTLLSRRILQLTPAATADQTALAYAQRCFRQRGCASQPLQLPAAQVHPPLPLYRRRYRHLHRETDIPQDVVFQHPLQPLPGADLPAVLPPHLLPSLREHLMGRPRLLAKPQLMILRMQETLGPWSMPPPIALLTEHQHHHRHRQAVDRDLAQPRTSSASRHSGDRRSRRLPVSPGAASSLTGRGTHSTPKETPPGCPRPAAATAGRQNAAARSSAGLRRP